MPGPIVSGVVSFIVPGLGQVLNGKYLRGIVVFVAAIALIVGSGVAGIGAMMIVTLIVLISAAADSYRVAKGLASAA